MIRGRLGYLGDGPTKKGELFWPRAGTDATCVGVNGVRARAGS